VLAERRGTSLLPAPGAGRSALRSSPPIALRSPAPRKPRVYIHVHPLGERCDASLKDTAEPMMSPAVAAPSMCRKAAGRREVPRRSASIAVAPRARAEGFVCYAASASDSGATHERATLHLSAAIEAKRRGPCSASGATHEELRRSYQLPLRRSAEGPCLLSAASKKTGTCFRSRAHHGRAPSVAVRRGRARCREEAGPLGDSPATDALRATFQTTHIAAV
jgi:hypothetical protein